MKTMEHCKHCEYPIRNGSCACWVRPTAKEPRKIGWLARLVRFLRDAAIVITCIAAILWLAKCPGDLEWWRPICIGLILPIIKRFL
jgi:hypothetical protein